MTRPVAPLLFVVALVSLFAGDALAAWTNNPAQNLLISSGPGHQQRTAIVDDGGGGVFIAWGDQRTGNFDVYVQHILHSGQPDPSWPANGLQVGSPVPSLDQYVPWIVSDDSGGAIVIWSESSSSTSAVFAQRVTPSGIDPTWPADGILMSATTITFDRFVMDATPDGLGGALVTWREETPFYKSYAQRVTANGAIAAGWPATGVLLCSAPNGQESPVIVSDGSGGAIAAWLDSRAGSLEVYAARVLASGTLDPVWPVNGRAVCTGNYAQTVRVAADGLGGLLVVWRDSRSDFGDIYVHHLLGDGTPDPTWVANGTPLCSATGSQYLPVLVNDGAGGALVAWQDDRAGNSDIYAHHVTARGVDTGWPVNGRAVGTGTSAQVEPVMASDGAGGVIVGWEDNRLGVYDLYAARVTSTGAIDATYPMNGRRVSAAPASPFYIAATGDGAGNAIFAWTDTRFGTYDSFAQRLGRHAYLGSPESELVSVKDVVLDQGGQVKVSWNASPLDVASDPNVVAYDVFRSVPTSLARRRLASGQSLASVTGAAGPLAAGQLIWLPGSTDIEYWEFVSTTTAVHFLSGYSMVVPTEQDSVAGGNPTTLFMVVARNAAYTMAWPSNVVGGYSVDNLAPMAPTAFTGAYDAGITTLEWNANPETDIAGYRIYRGTSASFVPGPGNLVATPTSLLYADAGAPGGYYKLSAIDVHGNEGPATLLEPSQTVDGPAGGALPVRVALLPARPLPARGSVSLEMHLPRSMRATLAIHDVAGRRVRVLVDGVQPAGIHRLAWDPGARAVAGLYFATLETEDGRQTSRILFVP
jgi:hypothetical protein